jgi:hypothetical protein
LAYALLLGLSLAACSNDLDALYGDGVVKDAGAVKMKAELPLLPMLPDLENESECKACAKDKCADARANCLDDDACVENLACRGICSDPGCLQRCDAKYPAFSYWFAALVTCVMSNACATPCKTGENFACVGKYDWPVAEERRFRVRFRFTYENFFSSALTQPFVVGAQVRACGGDPCDDNVLDSGRVDARNTFELGLELGLGRSSFGGFLEVEGDRIGPAGWHDRLFPQFPVQAAELWLVSADRSYIAQVTDFTLLDLETAAPLVIYISDCMGAPARVQVVLPDLPDTAVRHAKDGVDANQYNPDATNVGVAIVADVPDPDPAHPIATQAVQVATGLVVAERPAFVRAGWTTHLWLTPSAR